MGWICLPPIPRLDEGTAGEAEAAAPPSFWDDPAPSCPSSQLQHAPGGHLPSTPTECSALPVHPSPFPGHSPRLTNKVASPMRTASCSHKLLSWRGTGSLPRVTRNHCPKCPCDQSKGTAQLIPVCQECPGPFWGWVLSYFWQEWVLCKRDFPFFAVQSYQMLSSQEHFLFPDYPLSTSLAARLPRLS